MSSGTIFLSAPTAFALKYILVGESLEDARRGASDQHTKGWSLYTIRI